MLDKATLNFYQAARERAGKEAFCPKLIVASEAAFLILHFCSRDWMELTDIELQEKGNQLLFRVALDVADIKNEDTLILDKVTKFFNAVRTSVSRTKKKLANSGKTPKAFTVSFDSWSRYEEDDNYVIVNFFYAEKKKANEASKALADLGNLTIDPSSPRKDAL